jgi:arylsulfatase A-like enzyme
VDLYCTDKPCIGLNTTANPYLYTNEMTRLIHTTANDPQHKPLFVFLALHNVHQPVESPPEFVDLYPAVDYNTSNYARRVYNGMHSGVEYVLANVTRELKTNGMWATTVLVLAGDNGGTFEHGKPVPGSSNFPLRGHKYSWFEGGVRVASFVASPLLPPHSIGTTSHALLHISDWWATFAVLGGLSPTDNCTSIPGCVPVDGMDVWPVLTQAPNVTAGDAVAWRTELLIGVGGAKQTGGENWKMTTRHFLLDLHDTSSSTCTPLSYTLLHSALIHSAAPD